MRDRGIRRTAAVAALATFVLHVAANPHYGFFRDELYFIICGFRPAWGYVDQPPVVPLLSAASQLFGHSLVLLRALPAAFAAGGVYVTCLLAGELGGGIFAAVLATLAFLGAPVLESFGMKVSPDMSGLWLWPLLALYVLRIVKGADPRWWLAAGACCGVALESKYSAIFFAVALLLGLALTPQRRAMRTPWFLAGIGVAVVLVLPNFVWQALHGFPMWELLQNGAHGKNVIPAWWLFLFQQLLLTNLFVAPIWIVGLIWLLYGNAARFLGYAFVLLIAMMIALHAKHYYPADVYPILMAAGGVAFEGFTTRARFVRPLLAAATVAAGLFFCRFRCRCWPSRECSPIPVSFRTRWESVDRRWRPSACAARRYPKISPTCTAGRNSCRASRRFTMHYRRRSARRPRSSRATMERPRRSISSAPLTGYRRRSPATTTIGSGAGATTAATSSSTSTATAAAAISPASSAVWGSSPIPTRRG